MKLSENQFELIDAYLANQLSAADRILFETDLVGDAELRAEVERQRNIRLGLRAIGIERALARAKAQFEQTSTSIQENSPGAEPAPVGWPIVRPLGTWRYWAAAASVFLVLGLGYFVWQNLRSQQAEMAYADTFAATPTDELMKDFPMDNLKPAARTQLLDALKNYKAGNYNTVIDQLKTLPADRRTLYYKNYFLGLSYLANNQPTNAIPLLQQAQATPSRPLRQKAEWFLALAYVKNGQKKKALPMLNRISTNNAHPFNALARRVLQKIN